MARHLVRVSPLPGWLCAARLLGTSDIELAPLGLGVSEARLELDTSAAADLEARLRGLGFGGHRLRVVCTPSLSRTHVRRARLAEARRMRQRSPGFTRKGTQLDDEARLGLTPEALALAIGQRACATHRHRRVVDLCAGAGGNAIGFARAGCEVTAIELDAERLRMARHNAIVYGVADRIRFVHGDAREQQRELATGEPGSLWFVDPPWGRRHDNACVKLADLPLLADVLAMRPSAQPLWAKLPPSFDTRELAEAQAHAYFGVGEGDDRRVKLLLLEL